MVPAPVVRVRGRGGHQGPSEASSGHTVSQLPIIPPQGPGMVPLHRGRWNVKGLVFLQPSSLRDPSPEIIMLPTFEDILLITNCLSRVWLEVGTLGDRTWDPPQVQ